MPVWIWLNKAPLAPGAECGTPPWAVANGAGGGGGMAVEGLEETGVPKFNEQDAESYCYNMQVKINVSRVSDEYLRAPVQEEVVVVVAVG